MKNTMNPMIDSYIPTLDDLAEVMFEEIEQELAVYSRAQEKDMDL